MGQEFGNSSSCTSLAIVSQAVVVHWWPKLEQSGAGISWWWWASLFMKCHGFCMQATWNFLRAQQPQDSQSTYSVARVHLWKLPEKKDKVV